MERERTPPRTLQPRKRRTLGREISDPKLPNPSSRRLLNHSGPSEDSAKCPAGLLEVHPEASPAAPEFQEALDGHGVPPAGRARLLPLLKRWGPARAAEVLGLWSFLGDGGASRSVSTQALQVWGPPGAGKTEIVFGYLRELGIRHIRLNCACFTSQGELQARLAEELRRLAVADLGGTTAAPKQLQRQAPLGQQLRALDRLEAALEPALEHFRWRAASARGEAAWPVKVIIAFDQVQELLRLGPNVLQFLLSLPEVLQQGQVLTILTVGRRPMSQLGLLSAREPPEVPFRPYTEAETEALLLRLLAKVPTDPEAPDLHSLCSNGLLKFSAPTLGRNLHHLIRIGEEILWEPRCLAPVGHAGGKPDASRGGAVAALQQRVQCAVQQRIGLCSLRGLLEPGEVEESGMVAITAALRRMTKAEKRLLVSAYLGAHIDKDDDMQLFTVWARRWKCQKGAVTKQAAKGEEDLPVWLRTPKPVPLVRLLAIYHRLARQPQLLGPVLLETLMGMREAGLLRFAGDRTPRIDRELKVICCAELPLLRACAADLGLDLAEYLSSL